MRDFTLNQLQNSKEKELKTLEELKEKYKTKEEEIKKRIENIQNAINYIKIHRREIKFNDIQNGINFIRNNQKEIRNSLKNAYSNKTNSFEKNETKKIKVKVLNKKKDEPIQKKETKSIYEKAYEEMVKRNGTISEWLQNSYILQDYGQEKVEDISFENNKNSFNKNNFEKIKENFIRKVLDKYKSLKKSFANLFNSFINKSTIKQGKENNSITRTKEGDKSFVAKVYVKRKNHMNQNLYSKKMLDISKKQMSI